MVTRVRGTVRFRPQLREADLADILQLIAAGTVVAMWLAILSR